MRALALGGGSVQVNALLNDSLRQVDWRDLTAQEGLSRLLDMVSERMKEETPECLYGVEAAIVDLPGRRMVRKFLKEER